MRYIIVRDTGIESRLTLKGVKCTSIYTKKVNTSTSVVIDESYEYDITFSFPEYIFEVYKILNSFSRSKLHKIFDLNNNFIYNKKDNKCLLNDLTILIRKDKFQKMNIPFIDKNGAIKLTKMRTSEILPQTLGKNYRLRDYEKLRIVIFNSLILPYLRMLVF